MLFDGRRAGLIPEVGPLLDQMQALRFRVAPQTRAAILKSVPFPIADLLRRVLEGKGLEPLRGTVTVATPRGIRIRRS